MTPSTVSIQVPAIDDDTDLVAFFEEQLRDDVGDLHGDFFRAIDTDVSIHNDRAVLEDVVIENVEVDAGGNAIVEYRVEYSWFMGCSDMDGSDDDDGTAFGKREGDKWIFEIPKPHERRSTLDEF
jgi:hypothetical protein